MSEISLGEYCGQIENTIEQGRFAEAVAYGKHILEQYPRYVDAYRLLGKAMLESGQDEYAIDMFRRVLSAHPEDLIAWVGLSEVHNKHDELDDAIWCLERAFELAADNQAIEEELRLLYSRRDGIELQKTPLTTGALARLYLKGDLFSRAINDLRTILVEHPERIDLRVTLAEALWRNDQRLEASGICQQVLDELPYCLKTNLILGNIWASSGREEGQGYLRRAEALDPENKMAQELFGDASPLPAQQVQIVSLEYRPLTEADRPAWMAEMDGVLAGGLSPTGEEAALVDGAASLEAQIEIPSWLEEIALDEEAPVSAPPDLVESPEAQPPEEAVPAPAEEIPAWLATGAPKEPMEEQSLPIIESIDEAVTETEEETPEWLTGMGVEPIGDEAEEDVPAWLTESSIDAEEGVPATPIGEREEEYPEGLAELRIEAEREAAVSPVATVEQAPDWLSGLRDQFEEEAPTSEGVISPAEESLFPEEPKAEVPVTETGAPAPAEIPDWLLDMAPSEAQPTPAPPAEAPPEEAAPEELAAEPTAPVPAEMPDWLQELRPPEATAPEAPPAPALPMEAPAAEEPPAPAWMEQEEVSGDEALAWLEQLAAGKEEELQAQIKAETEIRMAEIMGRTAPLPEEAAPEESAAEMVTPAPAEIPDWLQEIGPPEAVAPEAVAAPPPEEAPAAEEPPAPAWMEQEEVSGDEALAWLEQLAAGKEDELQAQIKAESEIRMAEIMGRPAPPAEAPPKEPAPEDASEEALAAQVEEAFGWTAFGEPEARPEPAPPVEKAPPAETPIVEKVTPPPEAAAPEVVPEEPMIAPPAEEAFGWTAFGEPEARPEPAPPVEKAPPPEAAAPEVVPEEAFGWTAFGEPEARSELAPPVEETPPMEEMPPEEIAPPPVVERLELPEMVIPLPEEIAPPPVIEEAPDIVEMEVTEPVEAPAESFEAKRAYLKENSRDYDAWLAFARALWQANEREESLEAYSRVIRSGKLIENVIPDLEGYVEQWPDVHVQQVLGDAYVKDGQLQAALDLYRQALGAL